MSAVDALPLAELLTRHPCVRDFIASLGLATQTSHEPLGLWLERLPDEEI